MAPRPSDPSLRPPFARYAQTGVAFCLFLTVAFLPTAAFAASPPGCPENPRHYEVDRATSGSAHNGARVQWQLRTLDAPDWSDAGHANTTLWFGTDGDIGKTWVEVGVTDGFEGSNVYRFYFAHRYWNGSTYVYYAQVATTLVPVVGHYVTLQVKKSGDLMLPKVTDETTAQSYQLSYGFHGTPFDEWDVGAEYTCSGSSRVDKTYVFENQYRRSSDSVWLDASAGLLVKSGISGTGMAWCASPVYFRFWVHSHISTSGCN